jgi:hypothetical protein
VLSTGEESGESGLIKPEDFKKSNAILRAGKKKYARIILK